MIRFPLVGACALASLISLSSGDLQAQLLGHSPNNKYGFPDYYVATAGVTLEQCFEWDDPHCFNDPLDPVFGQELNIANEVFWPESFYWVCMADLLLPQGDIAIMLALEAAWGNPTEAVVEGQQVAFSRIRFRVDTVVPGTYTVLHPYGETTFENVGVGRRAIDFTDDCLHRENALGEIVPSCGVGVGDNFTTPLSNTTAGGVRVPWGETGIDRFLYWDPAVEPQAPAGYMGDPLVPHRVTGASNGRNEVIFQGPPNAFGLGVSELVVSEFVVVGRYAANAGLTSQPRYMDTATGGSQTLSLDAGVANANNGYFILSSLGGVFGGGTSPVIPLANDLNIPLRLDGLLALGLTPGGNPFVSGFAGVLDGNGAQTATLTLPPFPALAGAELFHAFVAGPPGQITYVSNNTTITFQ